MNEIDNVASMEEAEAFIYYWHTQGYRFYDSIPVDEKMLKYAQDKPCFMDWLLLQNHIQVIEPFQPLTIEIPVNSPEEYWEVWHRMNAGYQCFDSYRKEITENKHVNFGTNNSLKLWKYVDAVRIRHEL